MITDPLTKKTSHPKDVEKCLKRLQLLNKAIMLRRTKAILTQLPIKIIETVSLSFSTRESAFYDSLKDSVKTQLKLMIKVIIIHVHEE
jgi:SNF2 family DNA or RNA helicase